MEIDLDPRDIIVEEESVEFLVVNKSHSSQFFYRLGKSSSGF